MNRISIKINIELKNIDKKINMKLRKYTGLKIRIRTMKHNNNLRNKLNVRIKNLSRYMQSRDLDQLKMKNRMIKQRERALINSRSLVGNSRIINKEITNKEINNTEINSRTEEKKIDPGKKELSNHLTKRICMETGNTRRIKPMSPKTRKFLSYLPNCYSFQMKLSSISLNWKSKKRLRKPLN